VVDPQVLVITQIVSERDYFDMKEVEAQMGAA
jgi:hypothetical protein